MGEKRENHPGRGHRRDGRQAKKQFVRVRGERHVRWIYDAEDWQHVHGTGRYLVCPDQGCTQRLRASQNRYGTRYLSNCGDTSGCTHFLPDGGGGSMTDEHLWLQGELLTLSRRLGFHAELESGVSGARVDLRVAGKRDIFAFEVQRVSTNFSARRKAREMNGMQTVWFLPETERQRNTSDGAKRADPLFSEPCVRLGYRDGPGLGSQVMSLGDLKSKVWVHPAKAQVYLRAGVTVGHLTPDELSFSSGWLPLDVFVLEVLEGARRWYPQRMISGNNGGNWAGWLLGVDVERHQAAVSAFKERQRRLDEAAEREAVIKAECERRRELQVQSAVAEGGPGVVVAESVKDSRADGGVAEPFRKEAREDGEATVSAGPESRLKSGAHAMAPRDPWWRRVWKLLVG